MAQIAVIGAGYVGLTTAACFSSLGHDVVCADIDVDRVARLSGGEIPIVEGGLEALVREGMEDGRLRFVVGAENAARTAEPSRRNSGFDTTTMSSRPSTRSTARVDPTGTVDLLTTTASAGRTGPIWRAATSM